MKKTCHSNAEQMFRSFQEALSWRDKLDEKELKYLKDVDAFIAKFQPGSSVDLTKIVLKSNVKRFLMHISYVLMGSGLIGDFGFSEDFLTMKRYLI